MSTRERLKLFFAQLSLSAQYLRSSRRNKSVILAKIKQGELLWKDNLTGCAFLGYKTLFVKKKPKNFFFSIPKVFFLIPKSFAFLLFCMLLLLLCAAFPFVCAAAFCCFCFWLCAAFAIAFGRSHTVEPHPCRFGPYKMSITILQLMKPL